MTEYTGHIVGITIKQSMLGILLEMVYNTADRIGVECPAFAYEENLQGEPGIGL